MSTISHQHMMTNTTKAPDYVTDWLGDTHRIETYFHDMKVRGSYASPLSSDGGDTLPDNPPHPPRRITYQSPGNADPFAKAQKFPYDASHRRKHHAIRKPSSAGSDVRTISDHSPQTSTKHMLPAAWNPVAYNTGRGPRPETQQRIPKGLSQPRRRDQGPTSITPVSPVGLYDPTTNPKQTSPDVPPKVPEVPRLPTPDLEWPDEDGTCFCSCCPSPAEDKWHNRQDATDTDAKLTAQLMDAKAYIRRTRERNRI